MDVALKGQLDVSAGDVRDKIEELLDEIWRERGDEGDGFATVVELAQASGLCENTIRKRLKKLAREGRLLQQRVRRQSLLMLGQWYPTTGYRLKPPDTEPPD